TPALAGPGSHRVLNGCSTGTRAPGKLPCGRHSTLQHSTARELMLVPQPARTFDLVVAANRLPVDQVADEDGSTGWQKSPGGLVTAMDSVMQHREGAWVGWAGYPGEAPEPFVHDDMHLFPLGLSEEEVRFHYEGFSNDTLWPIYH